MPTLDQAQTGQRFRIDAIDGLPELVQRLMEFGLLEGETIEVIGFAPLGDPIEILVGDTRLRLRTREAAGIAVSLLE
jgi:ferrous iron transport protein A